MSVERLLGLVSEADDDDVAKALTAAAEARRELERVEAVLVRRARVQGFSWADVAAALGVTRQAVHRKHRGRSLLRTED